MRKFRSGGPVGGRAANPDHAAPACRAIIWPSPPLLSISKYTHAHTVFASVFFT